MGEKLSCLEYNIVGKESSGEPYAPVTPAMLRLCLPHPSHFGPVRTPSCEPLVPVRFRCGPTFLLRDGDLVQRRPRIWTIWYAYGDAGSIPAWSPGASTLAWRCRSERMQLVCHRATSGTRPEKTLSHTDGIFEIGIEYGVA